MEWLDAVDWGSVGAVIGTAAVVATAVSTGTTLWLQMRWRPEPDWAITGSTQRPDPKASDPSVAYLFGRMVNAGDGAAFRVNVSGVNCKADLKGDLEPRLMWQQTIKFVAVMHPGDDCQLDARATPENWGAAKIVVEWTNSPTRLGKRRRLRIPLIEVASLRPEADAE
jgi:hypothetical protein